MIVLSAVVLLLSLSSSDVINKANEAKQKSNIANAKEIVGIAKVSKSLTASSVESHLIYGAEWDAALKFF